MSQASTDPASNQEYLPDTYDEILPVERLKHGEHNPRRVQPKETLKQSIAAFGINRPLIVRPDPDEDVYHITDGWQRYQAAIACGWERLPVRVYKDTLDALAATEMESIVREWSTYEWAQYCHSLAEEIDTEADSKAEVTRQVAAHTNRNAETVRRYIDVLSLPEEVHILLKDGPDGSDQQWASLKNFNEDVRQYSDLQWRVADRIARNQSSMSETRVIEIAATAVEFGTVKEGIEFVNTAVKNPDMRIEEVRRQVLLGQDYDQYLVAPRVPIKMSPDKKQAVMEHCKQQRQSLADIITDQIRTLAGNLETNSEDSVTIESRSKTLDGNQSTTDR